MAQKDSDKAVFIPIGAMNQEQSIVNPSPDGEGLSRFAAGDYRYALNLRTGVSRTEHAGDAETLASTQLVNVYKVWNGSAWVDGTAPAGTQTEIGKLEDTQLRKAFIVYHNSTGEHSLVEYRFNEKAIYELLRWSGWNFSKTFVSMCRFGNYVVIAGKGNKPRIIDFTAIAQLKSTLGVKFCEYHISFAKWAPVAPLICRYQPNFGPSTVQLHVGLFQFSYRYIYVGGFRSRWSPISGVASNQYFNPAIGAIRLIYPGLIFKSTTPDSPITHDMQEFYQVVDYIEIAYRANSLDVWRSFKTIPVNKSGLGENIVCDFFNNTVGVPIDEEDFSQAYDDVPLESRATEYIDNRVQFGNNVKELEFVDEPQLVQDVAVYESTQAAWMTSVPAAFTGLSAGAEENLRLMNQLRQISFKSRGVYKLAIEFKDETGKKALAYTSDLLTFTIPDNKPSYINGYFEPEYALGFRIKTGFKPPMWATNFQILRTNCLNIDYFLFGVCNKFIYLVDDTTSPIADNVTTPEEIQAIQREFFDVGSESGFSLAQRVQTKYRKTKQSGSSANTTDLGKASRVFIDVNNWVNAAHNTGADTDFPLNKLYYQYREGDRVRFFGSTVLAPSDDSQISIFDLPIIEFTGRGIIVEKPDTLKWLPQRIETEGKFIIEIYRPKKAIAAKDMLFYEMGEWYPVTNAKTVSRDFGKRDWTYTNLGNVTATQYAQYYIYHNLPVFQGDVHRIRRNYYYDYVSVGSDGQMPNSVVPAMNQDKEFPYDRWERGNGRPNTAYTSRPSTAAITSEICFGGKYLQDALFNNINNFKSSDRFLYPQEYGDINEIANVTSYQVESAGSILLVFASVKTFSIYVNRTTLLDLSGRQQIALSDRVLGAYNSLLGDNGCINPESISFSGNGHVYWWDQLNGCWVRYGRDGNTDISGEYGMGSWFKEVGELLEPGYELPEEDRPWVISEFDNRMQELITLMAPSGGSIRGYANWRGMVFNEKRNQWKYAHSYYARMYARVNNEVISLVNGAVWRHEAGSDYLSIYGNPVDAMIEPVFNMASSANKIWKAITEIATHRWGIERTLSEYRGGTLAEQTSTLLAEKLVEKEGTFYSELLRDRNSDGFGSTEQDLANMQGKQLRSKTIRVLLKLGNTSGYKSLLHQVFLTIVDSPKNP